MTAPVEDEFTELVDADIPRVDLVDKAANGVTRFLIAKGEGGAGLLDADYVRDLIGKSEPEPEQTAETVTMTGSPAAIARMIHNAALAAQDPGITKAEANAMELDESTDGMDPTVALASPEQEAPGDPMDPGSPAWEAIDAATAAKWTSILARAKNAIGLLADREMLEAAAGDAGDAGQAMDLDDACCAIDYAISVLAPFAVAEQSEADLAAEAMEAVGKALGGFDAAHLDAIETLGAVRKAGRVLSSANEAAIRGAVDSLQNVLASLPQAPVAPDGSGQPVAKEETVTAPATATEPETAPVDAPVEKTESAAPQPEPAEAAGQVEKADGEGKPEAVAVYDKNGNLVGICDPVDITPIAGAKAEEPAEPAAEAAAPAAEAPADPADLTPAPAAEVGTPADDVGKTADATTESTVPDTTTDPTSGEVLKSIVTDAVTAALEAQSAAHKEVIAKQAADLAGLAEAVETLKGQVEAYGEQPAPSKVFTNGAVPPPHLLRGQDTGAVSVDMARAAELRKGLYGPDAGQQNRAALDMQEMAIAKLQEIHQRR